MVRKQKKYHYIYKTTCAINGKFYIGMHSTDNLDDKYLGSGKILWRSVKYHGKDNHIKEILEFCKDREQLKKREEEIVNEQLLTEKFCMNLRLGGYGGIINEEHHLKMRKRASDVNKILMKEFWSDPEKKKKRGQNITKILLNLDEDKKNRMRNGSNSWIGKKHSEETKEKISEKAKKRIGEKNSQYGTCWITNGSKNRKIRKGDIIPQGWNLGRKLKPK
jgi:hypothetical protein